MRNVETIRLWTIQRASVLYDLKRLGVLRADGRDIDPGLRRAYEWMRAKLTERLGPPPEACTWPIWAWQHRPTAGHRGSQRARPDLRARGYLPPGEHGVRITFDADRDNVLLSSFDAWHAVLNDHYHSLNDEDYERHEAFIGEKGAAAPEVARSKHESWERIFDLALIPDKAAYAVQAVLWEVPAERIKSIERFAAR